MHYYWAMCFCFWLQQFLKEESLDAEITSDELGTTDEFSDTDSEFDDDFDENDIECEQEIMAKLEKKLGELVSGDKQMLNVTRLHKRSGTKVTNCKLHFHMDILVWNAAKPNWETDRTCQCAAWNDV